MIKTKGEFEFYKGFNNQPCQKCGRLIANVGNGHVYCYRKNESDWKDTLKVCQECRDEKYGG